MIYLTVAHVRHGSPASSSDLTTVYMIVSGIMIEGHLQHIEEENLSGIKSLNLKQQAPGHLRLSAFMDEIQIMRSVIPLLGSSGGPSELTSSHVLYYESVSISDRFVSETLSFIIHHRTARLNERIHSLMKQYHPHLLSMFFNHHLVKRWSSNIASRSSRSSRHSSLRQWSSYFTSKVLISWHQCHEVHCQQAHAQDQQHHQGRTSWSSQL